MRFTPSFAIAALSLLGLSRAVVVTQIIPVTAYEYENVNVIVNAQGTPISTIVSVVSTGESEGSTPSAEPAQTSVAPAATSAQPAPPAEPSSSSISVGSLSHSHAPSVNNYNYITPTAPSPSVSAVTTSSDPQPPATEPTTSEAPTTSSTTPAPAPPTTSEAPPAPTTSTTVAPPAPTTSSEAPAPVSTSSAPAPSSSNSGGSGGTFSGDATYYTPGLGACGETNTESDYIAALNVAQFDGFGSMSNGNPVCGKRATINYQGKTVTVTITDKCPGCSYGDLDLSPAAFQQLSDEAAGRIKINWSFDN